MYQMFIDLVHAEYLAQKSKLIDLLAFNDLLLKQILYDEYFAI